ncbi:hypothetical protein B566_EDAN008807 [Ephemera danica]|nr:hypothetical protein B566_EDAN008807 [Ephemera danica]
MASLSSVRFKKTSINFRIGYRMDLVPKSFVLSLIRTFSLSVQFLGLNNKVNTSMWTESSGDEVPDVSKQKLVLKVAVLGVPNSGKSTLINQILNRRVCSTSSKVHTTIKKSRATCLSDNTQLIFLDTPGLVTNLESKRHNLKSSFLEDSTIATKEADVLAVVHDVSNKWTRDSLDTKVLNLLHIVPEKNSILVLNKVDAIKSKRILLDLVQKLTCRSIRPWQCPSTVVNRQPPEPCQPQSIVKKQKSEGWANFSEIFMVSALTGSGVGDIKEFMLTHAVPGGWVSLRNEFTDQRPREIAEMAVREKLLDHLPKEVPYNIKTKLEFWEKTESGMLCIVVIAECPVRRYSSMLLKNNGARIRMIAKEAEQALSDSFRCAVKLRIVVQDV